MLGFKEGKERREEEEEGKRRRRRREWNHSLGKVFISPNHGQGAKFQSHQDKAGLRLWNKDHSFSG